jgi:hypothetical protein
MIWLSVSREGVVGSRSSMIGPWLRGCGIRRQVDVGGIELVSTRGSMGFGKRLFPGFV